MSENPHDRAPCPDRIIDDVGGAFGMGAVGGSIWHFIAGLRNSPRGERLLGGSQAVRINAPRLGGSFAVWGGCFASFDCTLVYLRQKEDPWNSIASGFLTGGFLQLRQGPRAALSSAVFGGVLLGLIEGAAIMLNRMVPAVAPPPPSTSGSPQGFPQAGTVSLPQTSEARAPASASGHQSATPSSSDPAVLLSERESSLEALRGAPKPVPSPASSESTGWSLFSWGGSSGGSTEKKGSDPGPHSGDTLLVDAAPPSMPDFELKDDSWNKPLK